MLIILYCRRRRHRLSGEQTFSQLSGCGKLSTSVIRIFTSANIYIIIIIAHTLVSYTYMYFILVMINNTAFDKHSKRHRNHNHINVHAVLGVYIYINAHSKAYTFYYNILSGNGKPYRNYGFLDQEFGIIIVPKAVNNLS